MSTTHSIRYRLAGTAIMLLVAGQLALGEVRTWTSANGKKTIEAEFVSVEDNWVTIRRQVGDQSKLIKVDLAKLSQADRDFVAGQRAVAEHEIAVKRAVVRFYQILRKAERDDIKELVVSAARDKMESTANQLTPADRGTSPRIKQVDVQGETAVAKIAVKIMGKFRNLDVSLVREEDQWLLKSFAFQDDEGQAKVMDLETGQLVDAASSDGMDSTEGDAAGKNDRPNMGEDPERSLAANGRRRPADGGHGQELAGAASRRSGIPRPNGDPVANLPEEPANSPGPAGPPPFCAAATRPGKRLASGRPRTDRSRAR